MYTPVKGGELLKTTTAPRNFQQTLQVSHLKSLQRRLQVFANLTVTQEKLPEESKNEVESVKDFMTRGNLGLKTINKNL